MVFLNFLFNKLENKSFNKNLLFLSPKNSLNNVILPLGMERMELCIGNISNLTYTKIILNLHYFN